MRKIVKKTFAAVMAASLMASMVPVMALPVSAATVVRGEYDFSNMMVRRVWFNTEDPVFLIDNYQRVWLDKAVNVVAYGDYKNVKKDGNLMAPMKEMFAQIGAVYTEKDGVITIVMNGETLQLTVGSRNVTLNGTVLSSALTEEQIPVSVSVKEKYGEYNTFLDEDYQVTYLPVAYVLHTFDADIYTDGNVASLYAAIPVMNTEQVPAYAFSAKGYGNRFDEFLTKALTDSLEVKSSIADNIVALQNEDGGFCLLPDNTEMTQSDLAGKLGTLRTTSTLENGSTVAQLRYLAKYITQEKPSEDKYQKAFEKGFAYLMNHQNQNGGWSMAPTAAEGFLGNTEIGNKVTTSVLTLLSDAALLGNENYVFARKSMDIEAVKKVIAAGNDFLVAAQIENDGVKAGWATQVKADNSVTMGRTYERESVSAYTTKDVTAYLMRVHNPSDAIVAAVESAVDWLKEVKLTDKEAITVRDTSMNNGFDVYLTDGNGTWASNYVYDADKKAYRPLYSDVDPKRPDQPIVNNYEIYEYSKGKTSYNSADMILYATRTTLSYYDNDLANTLTGSAYDTWKGYLANGFPEVKKDPVEEHNDSKPETPTEGSKVDTDNNQNATTVVNNENAAKNDTKENGDTKVKTGDKTNAGIFVVLGIAAAAVIAGCGIFYLNGKKKNKSNG